MKYAPSLHHRQSTRLRSYDYQNVGAYFVTVCTFQRECLFDDPSVAKELGYAWIAATERRPNPSDFVVMPNHVHGIVWVPDWRGASAERDVGAQRLRTTSDSTNKIAFGTHATYREPDAAPLRGVRVNVPPGSLGAIVRTFKSQSSRRLAAALKRRGIPIWQRNYYERVIRDEDELQRIRQYIMDNPAKWVDDPNHPSRILSGQEMH